MRPSPHPSSIIDDPADWGQLTSHLPEFLSVRRVLAAVPQRWIQSLEVQIQRRQSKGIPIRDPLRYRLACLESGIIVTHETKYLLDLLENSLRVAAIQHLERFHVRLKDVMRSLPMHARMDNIDAENCRALVLELDFGQLIHLYRNSWKRLPLNRNIRTGFRNVFWRSCSCRDSNLFERDMALARQLRNTVAHSKRLISLNEMIAAYIATKRWTQPLPVDVDARIQQYRARRPAFLEDLRVLTTPS